jgi:hypothetical protein
MPDVSVGGVFKMDFYEQFPQSDIDIVDAEGNVRCSTKCLINKNTITIPDASINIEIGDEIRRKLPNGKEEVFTVLDPPFREQWQGFPARYEVNVSRKGAFAAGTGGNYRIHVSGANSRVNIGSTDNSRNIMSNSDVFSDMRAAIESSALSAAVKAELRQVTERMEGAKDRDSFVLAYQNFIASAANHMTVLAPFLPALSKLLSA